MIVVVFRSRIRPDANLGALQAAGSRMHDLGAAMPGFRICREYAAPDGEYLSIVEFEDEPSFAAWRRHPEYVAIQESGRSEFMSEYRIQVCALLRDLEPPAPGKRVVLVRWWKNPEADLAAIDRRMADIHAIERSLEGFIAYQDYTAADGENITVLEFTDDAALDRWRAQPELRVSLSRTRFSLLKEYHFLFCVPLREHNFRRPG